MSTTTTYATFALKKTRTGNSDVLVFSSKSQSRNLTHFYHIFHKSHSHRWLSSVLLFRSGLQPRHFAHLHHNPCDNRTHRRPSRTVVLLWMATTPFHTFPHPRHSAHFTGHTHTHAHTDVHTKTHTQATLTCAGSALTLQSMWSAPRCCATSHTPLLPRTSSFVTTCMRHQSIGEHTWLFVSSDVIELAWDTDLWVSLLDCLALNEM